MGAKVADRARWWTFAEWRVDDPERRTLME
jgi:hypothetical protein